MDTSATGTGPAAANPPGAGSSSSNNNAAGAAPAPPAPPGAAPAAAAAAIAGLNAPGGAVTFTTEQLAHILALFSNNQAGIAHALPAHVQPQAQANVTAAAFPPVLVAPANPPPNGTSLLDLFPDIEGSVLLDVARHELKPRELYKLDPAHKDTIGGKQVLDASTGVVTVRDFTPRDYPSYHSLYIPLSTYFNVLAGFVSTGTDAAHLYQVTSSFTAYLECLAAFGQEYHWSAVLQYHLAFHNKRRRDMLRGDYSGWATIDHLLQSKYLVGHLRAHPPAKAPTAGGSKARETATSNDVCRNFNKGFCPTTPCPAGRVHKCAGCGASDHGQSTCARAAAPA